MEDASDSSGARSRPPRQAGSPRPQDGSDARATRRAPGAGRRRAPETIRLAETAPAASPDEAPPPRTATSPDADLPPAPASVPERAAAGGSPAAGVVPPAPAGEDLATCPECGAALPPPAPATAGEPEPLRPPARLGPTVPKARSGVGPDGFARWERDAFDRYRNTREPAHLSEVLVDGSPRARRQAERLVEELPPARMPEPPAPQPTQWGGDGPREWLDRVRRERGAVPPAQPPP